MRGLGHLKGGSLAQFREQNELGVNQRGGVNRLTEEKITRWINLFYEKEGEWPVVASIKPVWDKDEKGLWRSVEGTTWASLNTALTQGLRGLEHLAGSSLLRFRLQNGLSDNIHESSVKDEPPRPLIRRASLNSDTEPEMKS
jgi:hypothetical protein